VAGGPPGRAAARRRADPCRVEPGALEQPSHDRVGVPHVAGADLVAAPDERRDLWREREDPGGDGRIVRAAPRALDRLRDIRDRPVAPPAHLVAEDPQPAGEARPDGPLRDGAAARVHRRHLDHPPAVGQGDLERRVVEVAARPVRRPCGDRLVDAPVEAHDVPARAERQPVEVDGGVHGMQPAALAARNHPDPAEARARGNY
jgi:hypothetical protein